MSASFERIDYSIRPAKYAERRMLRDVFRRVSRFDDPERYCYVGFGSVWFSDFILFHRALGVREMISIESKQKAVQRVTDNAPYNIVLKFQRASQVLPGLDWSRRYFCWLDYDDVLGPEMLLDARTVASKARSGSLVAITVRSDVAKEALQADDDDAAGQLSPVEQFREKFARHQVPPQFSEEDLYGTPFGKLSREMISNEIFSALAVRNNRLDDKISFKPICDFEYADGVLMTTVVGVFVAESDNETYKLCGFNTLDFLPVEGRLVNIRIPKITHKEFKILEAQMPRPDGDPLALGSIPEAEANNFLGLYRYLPNFVVSES